MKRIAMLSILALLTIPVLSACNTVEGAGKDIQNGGKDIQNSAERNK